MANYVLGLDLGPTSVGWAAIKIDSKDNYCGLMDLPDGDKTIPAIGARVFQAGIDNLGQGQSEEPKNKKRREKRSLRRMCRRRRGRLLRIKSLLKKYNLLPDNQLEIDQLNQIDPYQLRAKAVQERVEPFEFGRILMHFAKRRGFQSNRKDQTQDKKEDGKIKEGIKNLNDSLENKTLGQFWHEQLQNDPLKGIRNKGDYHWVAQRDMYRHELSLIWQEQSKYYSDQLSDELLNKIESNLFDQIPFELSKKKKRKIIGTCTLIPGKPRSPLNDRLSQEFRLLQKINDIRLTGRESERLTDEERTKLVERLMIKKDLTFIQIRKLLGLEEDQRINLEWENNKKILGNSIDYQLASKNIFGLDQWKSLSEKQKDDLWILIRKSLENEKEDIENLVSRIKNEYKINVNDINALEKITIPANYISYSRLALQKLIPHMREGKDLYEAIQAAGFAKTWHAWKKLKLPISTNGFNIPNPVVVATLFQVRKVVNALIKEFGIPQRIVIEMSRDLKGNSERRQQAIKLQSENTKRRERAVNAIRDYNQLSKNDDVSPFLTTKYILWEEQLGRCPYSNKQIGMRELFSEETEVDHILPRSMSLDNSMNNKVVCFRKENQDKGQRTVYDWLGHNKERWEQIEQAIDHWNPQRKTRGSEEKNDDKKATVKKNLNKWERFLVSADEIAENYTPERLLNDTSYIGREVRDYLKHLYPREEAEKHVKTTKGGITAELRRLWDLNGILGIDNKKNRDDLRHHALDAAVVAVTKPGMIQSITRELQKQNWDGRRTKSITVPQPWKNFYQDLSIAIPATIISHKVQRKVKGALHEETFYHKETNGIYAGKYITSQNLNGITAKMIKQICDDQIKSLVQERMDLFKGDSKKAFTDPLFLDNKNGEKVRIRKVRVWNNFDDNTMICIRDNIYVRAGSNHHVEIFNFIENEEEKYIRQMCSMYEAAQRIKNKECVISTNHIDNPNAQFIMSLSKGEALLIDNPNEHRVVVRALKMSHGEATNPSKIYITFAEHQVSRVEGNITSKTPNAYCFQSMSKFNEANPQKIHLDALGRIRWAND